MRIGSVFSGVGALELGLQWAGVGSVQWQIEIDDHAQAVLASRCPGAEQLHMRVEAVTGAELSEVDMLVGGFPCQDISAAGKGAGLDGPRSGLFWQFARLLDLLEPAWVCLENVGSAAVRWVDDVRAALHARGYVTLPIPLWASDVGAPHRRSRVFVVARHPRRTPARTAVASPWIGAANAFAGRLDAEWSAGMARLVLEAALGGDLLARVSLDRHQLSLWAADDDAIAPQWRVPELGEWEATETQLFRDRVRSIFARARAQQRLVLPTPTATPYGSSGNGCPGDGREAYAHAGTPSLHTMAREGRLPTPLASDAERGGWSGWPTRQTGARLKDVVLYPTPTAGDARASGSRNHEGSAAHPGVSLTDVVVYGRAIGERHGPRDPKAGHLNPAFVDWMMGLPIGWTDPSAPLAAGAGPDPNWWREPPVPGALPGSAKPLDKQRIHANGNAVVPQCTQLVGDVIHLLEALF